MRELELLAVAVAHVEPLELVAQQELLELGLLLDVDVAPVQPDLVERRLGEIDVARFDQRLHLAVEEGEDQRADVGAVDVGVAGHDHLVVAGLLDVELLADPGADGGDQRADLLVGEHLVDPVLLGVDDLAAERQDRLRVAIAPLLGGAAGRIALDDEQLGERRIAHRAVGELARQIRVLERRLAGEISRLARGLAGARGLDGLLHDHPPLRRVLLEELRQRPVDRRLHEALDRRIAELGLRLALELRVLELHRDDRREPLAHVLTLEVLVLLLELADLARVGVQRPGECGTEAREVRAALVGVDVVGEREKRLLVGVVPLHRDLHLADVAAVVEVDDLLVQGVPRSLRVQVVDEVDDAAVVLEAGLEGLAALVDEPDPQALREERHLAEALLEDRAVVVDRLEDLEVGQEGDARPVPIGLRTLLDGCLRDAPLVGLGPLVAVAPDREVEPLGERVDHRDAHAVEAARDLVAATVPELTAGVQDGEDDLGRRLLLLLHDVDRNAAAVVGDRDARVRVDDDVDLVGLAGQGLVDRVVHHLVDQVMEAAHTGRADVHPWTLAHRLETLENGDVLCAV